MSNMVVSALNHVLSADPSLRLRLVPFEGRVVRFDWEDTVHLDLKIQSDGLFSACVSDHPNVILTLGGHGWTNIVKGIDGIIRHVRINGEVACAEVVGYVLRHLRWDPMYDLTRLLGPLAASIVGSVGSCLFHRLGLLAETISQHAAEFVVEESQIVASMHAVRHHVSQVDQLRESADRLQARLSYLEQLTIAT